MNNHHYSEFAKVTCEIATCKKKIETMKRKMNKQKDTSATDTFKGLLLMSVGIPIGNIYPYRLKSAPSCFGGFERMTVMEARSMGVDIPPTEKPEDEVYIRQLGPAVFREWMPTWMFEAAFEPVPKQNPDDRGLSLMEEINNHRVVGEALNEKSYALSVELLMEHGANLRSGKNDKPDFSICLRVEDQCPVKLVITEVTLGNDGRITIKGHESRFGEEYEQVCDVEHGIDILHFILAHTGL